MKIELKGKDGSSHQIEDIWMAVHSKLIRNVLNHGNPNEAIELPLVEGDILTVIISWVKEKDSLELDKYDSLFVCDLLVASEFMEIPLLSSTIISWWGKQISSGNISASDVLIFARNYLIIGLENLCLQIMQPSDQNNLAFLFGGFQGEGPTSLMSVMDPSTGVISNLPVKLPFTLAYSGAVMEKSGIYLTGGFQENVGESKGLFKLNLEDFTLAPLSKMREKRNYVSLASNDGFIYCLGGHTGTERLRTAERYDIDNNQWYDCPSMREARSDAGAAALNGKIYIVGGFDGHHQHSSVEVFDPEAGTWTFGKPMFKKRSGVKATVMNGKLYVVGGWSGGTRRLSCGEVYDPHTDKWTPLPEMNVPRSNYSLFVADGQLVVAGGYDGSGLTQTTEILNERKKKWVFGRNMMDARSASAAVSISKEMISPEVLKSLNDLCNN